MVKRILVATDRSERADRAVEWAADMAGRYEAQLLVVQVTVPHAPDAADVADDLARFTESLAGEAGRARVVIGDDPALAVCDVAHEEDVDIVVVGNVGMSGRKEFLLGNVANRISHNAGCSVVIIDTSRLVPRRRLTRIFGRSS